METLLQDVRYSIRMFRKSPLFVIVAVAALALGIGANTTIFTLVYALLLRPLPGVDEPQRLISVFTSDFSSTRYGTSSYPDYIDYRDSNEVFEGLAAYREDSMVLNAGDNPQRIRGVTVSGNYFSVLGGQAIKTGNGDLAPTAPLSEKPFHSTIRASRLSESHPNDSGERTWPRTWNCGFQ